MVATCALGAALSHARPPHSRSRMRAPRWLRMFGRLPCGLNVSISTVPGRVASRQSAGTPTLRPAATPSPPNDKTRPDSQPPARDGVQMQGKSLRDVRGPPHRGEQAAPSVPHTYTARLADTQPDALTHILTYPMEFSPSEWVGGIGHLWAENNSAG
ncbi:hypothetical protein B0H10DRAFT_2222367 [Mycena sp. CBHHK59/15]|nr:hypothetical protein B0H10DRAFT_2222367 [Mycena sp. CBHHK59/15]